MKTSRILFAGAILASAALAGMNDPLAAVRYRLKYGRAHPSAEARQKAAPQVAQACCRQMHASSNSGIDERFRMKYGRQTPAARQETASHIKKCLELDRCPLVHTAQAPATASVPDTEARFRAKYGRPSPAPNTEAVLARADRLPCEMECCKHTD